MSYISSSTLFFEYQYPALACFLSSKLIFSEVSFIFIIIIIIIILFTISYPREKKEELKLNVQILIVLFFISIIVDCFNNDLINLHIN